MGLDVSCNLIMGVEVERVTKTRTVTKYDRDTGEPEEVEEEYEVFQVVDTGDILEEFDRGLLHEADYMENHSWVYGTRMKQINSHRYTESYVTEVPEDVEQEREEAKDLLSEVGCEKEPSLIMQMEFSY